MNIFFLELRNLRRSALTGIITISLILYAMLAFFPSMQSEAMQELAGAKLEGIDPVLLNALGLSEMLDFSVITNYFGYVMQFAALAIMVLATQQAVALLIKEETDGTIEFLCSKPISRDEIFFQKTLTHIAILIFSAVFYALITIIGYLSFSDYTFGEAARESVIFFSSILFVEVIFSAVGILLSTLIKNIKGITGVSIAIVFGTYILGIISTVAEQMDFLALISPLDWIKTQKLMTQGILPEEWIIGFVIISVCILTAWLRYRKKDLLI